jgi:phosphatidylinositol transfer protein SFH5
VPTIFSWIFWLFKPILPTATFNKMQVVGQGPAAIGKELLPIIDKEELPKQYGGEADLE